MDFRPEYDNRLKQLAELNGVIDADATHHNSNDDPRIDLLEQKQMELTRQLEFVLTELKKHQSNFTKLQQALKEVNTEFEFQEFPIVIMRSVFESQEKMLILAVAMLVLIKMWDLVKVIMIFFSVAVFLDAISRAISRIHRL